MKLIVDRLLQPVISQDLGAHHKLKFYLRGIMPIYKIAFHKGDLIRITKNNIRLLGKME
jgi:hypothetical protein